MSSQKVVINSDASLARAIGLLKDEYAEHRYLVITVRTGKDRSVSQNAISHVWYHEISRELREDSPEGVKAECKLRFGVPILRAEEPDFREMYDSAIKHRMSYEDKLAVMRYMPVSSLMTKKQLSQYLQDIQAHYAQRGVLLEFPAEDES